MSLVQIVVLALVQGITEFLPISSSAHLILVPPLTGWPDQGTEIDIAVHVGTLGAVLIYFHKDVLAMLVGLWQAARGRRTPGARLAGLIVVASLPVFAAGFALVKTGYADLLRNPEVIAWATLVFALVLVVADKMAMTVRRIEHLGWLSALFIGVMQALALIPGASRAGVTITAGRLLAMERAEAARFSMLLSIPAILAAGGYATLEVIESGDAQFGTDALFAAWLAFMAALVAISLLMNWLQRSGFMPFVIYRVLLAGVLFWWIYG